MDADTQQRVLFDFEEHDDRFVYRLIDPTMSKADRMKIAIDYPTELHTPHNMSPSEFKSFMYNKASSKPIFKIAARDPNAVELPWMGMLSAAKTKELGMWKILGRIREIVADKEMHDFVMGAQTKEHLTMRGTIWDATISTTPCHQNDGVHISPALLKAQLPEFRQFGEKIKELILLLSEADEIALNNIWGPEVAMEFKTVYERNRITDASLTNGHNMISGTQINHIPLGQQRREALGATRGDVHPDIFDDAPRTSLLYILDNSPPDYFPGRFNLVSARISFPLETFSVIAFSGRDPHCSSGSGFFPAEIPETQRRSETAYVSPLVGEKFNQQEIHIIRYPRCDAFRARGKELSANFWKEELSLPHFGTVEKQKEFYMLQYIKNKIVNIRAKEEAGEPQPPELFTEMFKWQDKSTGEWKYPPLESARICLAGAGVKDKEWEKRHKAFLSTNCGDRLPPPPAGQKVVTPASKAAIANAKWQARKRDGVAVVECGGKNKTGGLCKKRVNPGERCGTHTKRPVEEKEVEESSMSEEVENSEDMRLEDELRYEEDVMMKEG